MLDIRPDGFPRLQSDDEHVYCASVSLPFPPTPTRHTHNPKTHPLTILYSFMALSPAQVGYFIQQVGLAAASFGVTDDDVQAVGCALSSTFGYRCSPPTDPLMGPGPSSQSICTAEDCPVDVGGVCALYPGGTGISQEPAENTPGCRGPA